jgi:hypothetical protein
MSSKYGFSIVTLVSAAILFCAVGYSQTTAFVGWGASPKAPPSISAGIPVNYNQARVGTYTVPNPLVFPNGKPVRGAKEWYKKRRPEILRLFEENVYGRSPGRPAGMSFYVFDKGTPALGGKAIRRQVTIYFSSNKNGPKMDLLIYLPAAARRPVPLLLHISFSPNSRMVNDPGVRRSEMWGFQSHQRLLAPRGMQRIETVPVTRILDAGFGFATFYYGDVDPDFLGGTPYGVRALYMKPGQTKRAPDAWGSIAAWAWGLSRAMDYLETDKGVDAKRVAIEGLSRLGKTVLWAGATDTRFALVIDSCSGAGGSALLRRNYGETIAHLVAPTRFPYWFCPNFQKYARHADQLPVDANELIALLAPRPVLLQTGNRDLWGDPKGAFLAAVAAGPAYRFLGKQPLGTDQWPPAGKAILDTIGYYMHNGGHGTFASDWDVFLKFMNMDLQQKR